MLTSTLRQIILSKSTRQSISALNPLILTTSAARSYGCMVHADTVPIVVTDGNAADLLSTATPAVSLGDITSSSQFHSSCGGCSFQLSPSPYGTY